MPIFLISNVVHVHCWKPTGGHPVGHQRDRLTHSSRLILLLAVICGMSSLLTAKQMSRMWTNTIVFCKRSLVWCETVIVTTVNTFKCTTPTSVTNLNECIWKVLLFKATWIALKWNFEFMHYLRTEPVTLELLRKLVKENHANDVFNKS